MATKRRTFQSYKLGGTEVEHDVFDPTGEITVEHLIRFLVLVAQPWGVAYGARFYDEAGALDYVDANKKAEHAGPEITNGREAMLYELAGSVRWATVAYYADRAVGRPGTTWVMKTNTNARGFSAGGNHLNFLMPKWVAPAEAVEALKTFVVTLELLVGAGAVIPKHWGETLIGGTNFGFVIGARGFHVIKTAATGANSTTSHGRKPIFMNRAEPLADSTRFWRTQIVGLDSNILPSVIQFKMDVLFLVIEMAVLGALTPIELWEPQSSEADQIEAGNVCDSMRLIACNWTTHLPVVAGPFREMTAREIQLHYYEQADKYVHGQASPDPDQLALLDHWWRLLAAFDTEEIIPVDAYGLSDWVTKAAWLARREEKAEPALKYGQAQAVQLDYQGYRFRGGKQCTPLRLATRYGYRGIWRDVVRALSTPPPDTRAWGRGQAVKLRPVDLNPGQWAYLCAAGIESIPIKDPRIPATTRLMQQLRRWSEEAAAKQTR